MMPFTCQPNALIWRGGHETVRIEPWGADSLRVRAAQGPEVRDDLPGALLPPAPVEAEITVAAEVASLRVGRLCADVTAEGQISFTDTSRGMTLLAEPAPRFIRPPARRFKPLGSDLYHITAEFQPADGERFYGLGQHQHGLLDQKGCVIDLWHRNTEVSIPFLVSSRGYGFLWHNPAVGRVELGRNGTRWVAEASRQMDYWITAGSYAEIMAHYADATGHAPVLPQWVAGFWQCKLRYRTQEELLEVAREYRRRGLPLDVIVVDFFHWTRMGEWRFDPVGVFIGSAHAQERADITIRTPAIQAIQQRMAERFQSTLAPLFDSGALGFGNDGLVVLRDPARVPLAQRTAATQAVADENRDRRAVYREIAVANGKPEWEEQIRQTFAREWVAQARPGWWYQDSAGNWKQK